MYITFTDGKVLISSNINPKTIMQSTTVVLHGNSFQHVGSDCTVHTHRIPNITTWLKCKLIPYSYYCTVFNQLWIEPYQLDWNHSNPCLHHTVYPCHHNKTESWSLHYNLSQQQQTQSSYIFLEGAQREASLPAMLLLIHHFCHIP